MYYLLFLRLKFYFFAIEMAGKTSDKNNRENKTTAPCLLDFRRVSLGPGRKERRNDFVSDLLGLYSIDDRVEGRWDDNIEVGKHNVKSLRDIVSKAMCKDRKERWYIEHEDDTDVETTGAQGLLASILRRDAKYSTEGEDVVNSY